MKIKARTNDLVIQTANSETMIYDLLADRAYLLNETCSFVWQMCDGENTLADISQVLAEKTNQPPSEDIVKLAIDSLREFNLMTEAPPKFFSKTNRRKVIKQIGLASMIALPIISALTAPTAANAASGAATCPGGVVAGSVAPYQRCTSSCSCANRAQYCCTTAGGFNPAVCDRTFYGSCINP